MKLVGVLVLAMIAVVGLLSTVATAATWYVDAANGNDAIDPPEQAQLGFGSAFRTIGRAVVAAALDDVIKVNSGTYSEFVFATKSLSIIGVGTVILDGNLRSRRGINFDGAMAVRLENLTFQNCSWGIYLTGRAPWINATIENCRFLKCDEGAVGYNYVQATVRNSLFFDNSSGWYLIARDGVTPYLHLLNCTLANNTYGVWSEAVYGDYQYSIFANNSYGWYDKNALAPRKVVFCDFWPNINSNYPALPIGANYDPNYALDPQFVDQIGRNYYLSSTSPLLDLRIKDETGRLATIGALKCGFVDDTEAMWAGWTESGGPLAGSVKVELVADGIILKPGIASATIVSPTYDSGNNLSKLVRLSYLAIEFESEDPGMKSFVDYDLSTPVREIQYQVSNNEADMGAWLTTTANNLLEIPGRYYRVAYTLNGLQ